METERIETLKQLADANDLLSMLECLTDSFAGETPLDEVPWSGIRLTLRQVREAVLAAKENVSMEAPLIGRNSSSNAKVGKDTYGRRSLADRVEQLPQSGGGSRTRELVNHVSAANSSGRTKAVRANAPLNESRELE